MTSPTPLQSAAKRSAGNPVVVPVDFGEGGVVDLRFVRARTVEFVNAMAAMRDAHRSGDGVAAMNTVVALLDVAAEPETAALIADALKAGTLDVEDLGNIANVVVHEVSGIPPTRLGPLSDGSGPSGESSTDGALPVPSMPPPSPSTDS